MITNENRFRNKKTDVVRNKQLIMSFDKNDKSFIIAKKT